MIVTSSEFVRIVIVIVQLAADGVIQIWRNYAPSTLHLMDDLSCEVSSVELTESEKDWLVVNVPHTHPRRADLLTAWRAFDTHVTASHIGVLANVDNNTLHVAGDTRLVRVFDLHTERHVLDMHTHADSPVTSLARDILDSNILYTGTCTY